MGPLAARRALLACLLALLCAPSLGGAARGCSQTGGRRLAQDASARLIAAEGAPRSRRDAPAPAATRLGRPSFPAARSRPPPARRPPAAARPPRPPLLAGDPQPGAADDVRTLEVDVLQRKCIVSFNSYFNAAARGARELRAAGGNPRATAEDCCTACHAAPGCNAWQWCPLEAGCALAAGAAGAAAAPALYAEHYGCQLLAIAAFSPYRDDFDSFRFHGPDVPFVAGAPLNVTVPQIDGFAVDVGADLDGQFDYACAGGAAVAVANASAAAPPALCAVEGSASDVAAACVADARCAAFVYWPRGLGFDGAPAVGVLKGAGAAPSAVQLNPTAVAYFRASGAGAGAAAGGDGGGGPSTAVVASVAAALAAVLLAAAATVAVYARRYRRMLRAAPAGPAGTGGKGATGALDRCESGETGAGSGSGPPSPPPGGGAPADAPPRAAFTAPDIVVLPLAAPPAPGSSGTAAELMAAFSEMYARRPPADGARLAGLLEEGAEAEARRVADERAREAALLEAASAAPRAADGDVGPGAAPLSAAWLLRPEEVALARRADGTLWQLGVGAFGTVYKGRLRGAADVAVKVLHRPEEAARREDLVREAGLLRGLRDRHVVAFLGAVLDGPAGAALLVTELMELGDLWRAAPARGPSGARVFAWRARGRRVAADVARGLAYLHARRVVHLDLKSANILLTRAGVAKIADVGMARVLQASCLSAAAAGAGTFAWSAPEVLAGRRCTAAVDVYSYGVVLWEICTGEAPVRGAMRTLRAPEDCPEEIVALQAACVAEEPAARPTAAALVAALVDTP
jgi:hypothetical protein